MEGGVEDCHLRNLRKDLLHGPDTREVCRVVERSEGTALVDGLHNLIINHHRGGKIFAPVNHPVPHSGKLFQAFQNSMLLGEKSFENEFAPPPCGWEYPALWLPYPPGRGCASTEILRCRYAPPAPCRGLILFPCQKADTSTMSCRSSIPKLSK